MILILGGTRDAHQIALGLERAGMNFVVSLAGATRKPVERSYATRIGGFGGADGLVEYLCKEEITGLIDATHPFAENISRSAVEAATVSGVPVVRYVRPAWDVSGFQCVRDLDAAARALPSGARAFLTVGGKSLAPFIHRSDVWFLFRGVDPMESPFAQGEALIQRPPFVLEAEIALMQERGITHLVTKNSGGEQTRAKLDAATKLGISVIMVVRPVLPVVESASTVSDILRWAAAI
ncbi:MAG: cobalt-precorrin-6A reductase [Rhodobacteraceae bacterium]|nr:cobalt-precorrin-6A reductase [Paracoccaceae bacterium]